MEVAPPICLSCRERLARCRGACDRCYTRLKKAVAHGRTTWSELEAAGLALPAQPAGQAWMRGFWVKSGGPG